MAARDMPVRIEPYDAAWPLRFAEARARLEPLLAPWLDGPLEHVGSTAVPGLAAKPIVDVLAPVRDHAQARAAIPLLERHGWIHWSDDPYQAWRHWLLTPSAEARTHHLTLLERDDPEFEAMLAWRDHLRADAAAADAYAAAKRVLAARFPDDRAAYADGKTAYLREAFRAMGRTLPRPREYRRGA